MFAALGYLGKFLDLGSWIYKCHYTVLTEPGLQCVAKTGRNFQILSGSQKREEWRQAHSIIVVSFSVTCIYLYGYLFMLQRIWAFKELYANIYCLSLGVVIFFTGILMSIMYSSVFCFPVPQKCITIQTIQGYIVLNFMNSIVFLVSNFIEWNFFLYKHNGNSSAL